jgi:peroxiredoxin
MKYQLKFSKKMFFLVLIIGALMGLMIWNHYIAKKIAIDVKIPLSKNITYNQQQPMAMSTASFANEYENHEGKPILLYLYTSWCSVCQKNFPIINEVIREFQNTDLYVIALAVDRDIDANHLQNYLNNKGNIYFVPRYLEFKEGFLEFLKRKNINYRGIIPYTVLISADGEISSKYSGVRDKNHLRNMIIKILY